MPDKESSPKGAPVELLLGPYRSGKTRSLLQKALRLKQQEPLSSMVFVVPSARYKRLLHELLADEVQVFFRENEDFRGIFSLQIQPFHQICQTILRKSRPGIKLIPEELRPAILSQALTKLKNDGELKTLKQASEFQGLCTTILELLDEFQRAGLSPQDLLDRLASNSALDSRYFELAKIYEAYWQELADLGYYDSKKMSLAARAILFSELESSIGIDHLFIDGFDRISHIQAQIFSGLCRQVKTAHMTFDYPGEESFDKDPFRLGGDDYSWKQSSFSELISNLHPRVEKMPDCRTAPVKSVSFITTLDKFAEMSEIARQCKLAILEERAGANEILVVVRSISSYAGAIELAFEEAGLEHFIDGNVEIRTTPLWQVMHKLFYLAVNGFQRSDLLEILRSPYFNLETVGLTRQEVSWLDNDSYECRLVGDRQVWQKFLSGKGNKAAYQGLNNFFDAVSPPQDPLAPNELASWLEDLLEKYLLELPLAENGEERHAEEETLATLRRSLKVLILQDGLLGTRKETYNQFLSRLTHLIESSNYARRAQINRHILICSADLAPNRTFKEVYIAGLNEGDFPRRHRSHGFTSPEELKRWQSFGVDLRNPRNEPGFERALFYSLMERASSAICFSRPELDMGGDEYVESFYISELDEFKSIKPERLAPYARARSLPYSAREACSSLLWYTGFSLAQKRLDGHPDLTDYWSQFDGSFAAAFGRQSEQQSNPFNGCLTELVAASAIDLKLPDSWAATNLNDFGQCPFRFWLNHVLRLRPREELATGLTLLMLGRTYHKSLELFFQKLIKIETGERRQAAVGLIEEAFSEAVSWVESQPDFQPSKYWESERKELLFRLRRFIVKELDRLENDKNELFPALFEVRFGDEKTGSFPALIIEDEGRSIRIRGSIDRLDLPLTALPNESDRPLPAEAAVAMRVVDYKTGSSSISLKEAESGRNIQLPLYALAVQRSIFPQSTVLSGQYLSINAGKPVGQMDFTSEKLGGLLGRIEDKVRDYLRRITSGDFSVKPNGSNVCKKCDHKRACRVGELSHSQTEEDGDA